MVPDCSRFDKSDVAGAALMFVRAGAMMHTSDGQQEA
jgi:hypothetical protein